jgi:hypothetical protein
MHAERDSISLLETHEAVAAVSTALYSYEEQGQIDPSLLEYLKTLNIVSQEHPTEEVSKLCSVVHCNIEDAHRYGVSLAPEQKSRLLEHCEELRLRIIADSIWLHQNDKSHSVGIALDMNTQQSLGSTVSVISKSPNKITHASVGTTRVILMPRLDENSEFDAIYDELMEIYESKPNVESWILDLSLLNTIPLLLLANLVAYAGRLRQQGDDLHICWLREGVIPEIQMERMRRIFDLKKVGGHYFSCRTNHGPKPA